MAGKKPALPVRKAKNAEIAPEEKEYPRKPSVSFSLSLATTPTETKKIDLTLHLEQWMAILIQRECDKQEMSAESLVKQWIAERLDLMDKTKRRRLR